MSMLTSGVALCTCNGRLYIEEQLASILAQTRLPDRMVINDDASDDGTWEYLQQWQASCPIPVAIHRNTTRVGVATNFENAVRALDTDLIFFCDQDDVWLPNKVERLHAIFESDETVQLAHTDAILVNRDAENLGSNLFEALNVSHRERAAIRAKLAFEVLIRRNVVTGATTVLRRSLAQSGMPFPTELFHDEWLALVASATGKMVLVDEPTIKYRQHGKNVVGVLKKSRLQIVRELWWHIHSWNSRALVKDKLEQREVLVQRLQRLGTVPEDKLEHARAALRFARFRFDLPSRLPARILPILGKVVTGKYRKFSHRTWSDVFVDVLYK